ncbi:MAG: hypothetical protein KKC55_16105 [Gammaproteobacteria bacterium]|nr:hypothetical protein [Gammaproteobacteria bacterium]
MKHLTLAQIKKKIKKLEKKYELIPKAAILAKSRIEKQMRQWMSLEQDMKEKMHPAAAKAKEKINENNL